MIHNPSSPCSCTVNIKGFAVEIAYCPMHKAAPDLLAACERALPWIGRMIASNVHMQSVAPNDCVGALNEMDSAICKAGGRI